MKKYRVLTLTDHNTHGEGESIYELLRALAEHPRCELVEVASRSCERNKEFFDSFDAGVIYSDRIDQDFIFHKNGIFFQGKSKRSLSFYDVLFLRLDRPVSNSQLMAIEANFPTLRIVNSPTGIVKTGSKEFLLNFPDLCPGICLCESVAFVKKQLSFYPLVLKPLHGYGGSGLIKIDGVRCFFENECVPVEDGLNILSNEFDNGGKFVAMKYLRNVNLGDKRIVVVGDEILGATLRMPPEDSWLCNLKMGGRAIHSEPDEAELKIASKLSPHMREHGVIIYGFDTLVDDDGVRCLSEINTLNVGGLKQIKVQNEIDVFNRAANLIFKEIEVSHR